MTRHADLDPLLTLIRQLRADGGCPWDQEQTFESVRSYVIEEAHEVASALDRIDSEDGAALREELGDLLFQCCFVAVLAEEDQLFRAVDCIHGVHDKMVARHPHVFADDRLETAEEVASAWERRKQQDPARRSVLDGVPDSMPSLTRAHRVGQKVAAVGFDWPHADAVLAKVDEELAEVHDAIAGGDAKRIEDELGDLLLSIASVARHLGIDPERALSRANHKFETRYRIVEAELPPDRALDADELEARWQLAKAQAGSRTDDES